MKFISGSVKNFDWKCLDTDGIVYGSSAAYTPRLSNTVDAVIATAAGLQAVDKNAVRLRLTVYSIHGPENSNEVVYYDSQAMNLIAWLEGQEHIRL